MEMGKDVLNFELVSPLKARHQAAYRIRQWTVSL